MLFSFDVAAAAAAVVVAVTLASKGSIRAKA